MQENSFREKPIKHLPLLTFIVCIIQPILDVISYMTDKLGISNIYTLLLRSVLLVAVFLTAFIITKKRKVYYITVTVLIVYTLCHILACIRNGYSDPVGDLTNMVRIYQMPLFTICFISYIKANEKVYKSLNYGLVVCLLIIAVIEIISVITKTNPYTYENKSIGIIGWFCDSSAQSAVLSALVPVFIATAVRRFNNNLPLLILSVAGGSLILYLYATRLAYIALLATLAGLVITLLITDRKAIKSIIILCVAVVIFVGLIPVSPMQQNQDRVAENAIKKQENIDNLIAEYDAIAKEKGLSGEELKTARLEGAYEYYLGAMIDRFGLEKTALRYNFSEKASDICDVRLMKNTYCSMLMEEQGPTSMLFGMELSDMVHEEQVFDVENDFHGIFYLCGGVGLVMMIAFLGYFIFITAKALFTDFKNVFTTETAGWGICLITLLLHVYATCGVLRRPSASFYLSVVLGVIPYLINKERTPK